MFMQRSDCIGYAHASTLIGEHHMCCSPAAFEAAQPLQRRPVWDSGHWSQVFNIVLLGY
jgi:hypothetical protein